MPQPPTRKATKGPDVTKEGARGFRFIDDLTSDVYFEAWGRTLEDAFAAAAEAVAEVMCKTRLVRMKKALQLKATGKNLEDLMFNWLQTVIQTVDIEQTLLSRFEVESVDPKGRSIAGTAWGEEMRPELGGTQVKGVTYYKFSFKKEGAVWKATASLDV